MFGGQKFVFNILAYLPCKTSNVMQMPKFVQICTGQLKVRFRITLQNNFIKQNSSMRTLCSQRTKWVNQLDRRRYSLPVTS